MPRLRIDHTSEKEIGQIYLPSINWVLALACIWLVLSFRTSGALAAAYGVAVTTTMGITTVLLYVYAREAWKVSRAVAAPVAAAFLVVDLAFFGANIVKIGSGGWVPLVIALFVYTVMTTWKRGRIILAARLREATLPADVFLQDVEKRPPTRVRGTAVFMDRIPEGIPPPLLHNLKHNKILHERVVFLTVVTDEVPRLKEKERTRAEFLGPGFWRVTLHYGFMENPDMTDYRDTLSDDRERLRRFWLQLLEQGVYLLPDGRFYLSTVHTEREIAETLQAVDTALASIAKLFRIGQWG